MAVHAALRCYFHGAADRPREMVRWSHMECPRGFPRHERGLSDARFMGLARTLDPHPLMIAGDRFAPIIMRKPGVETRKWAKVVKFSGAKA
jgi:hypothetical protein